MSPYRSPTAGAGGASMRHIHRFGEDVTLTNTTVTHDPDTDWGDTTETTDTTTVPAFIDTDPNALIDRTPAEVEVEVEAIIYVYDGDLPYDFDIRGADVDEPTLVTDASGREWRVLTPNERNDGIYELEANRV